MLHWHVTTRGDPKELAQHGRLGGKRAPILRGPDETIRAAQRLPTVQSCHNMVGPKPRGDHVLAHRARAAAWFCYCHRPDFIYYDQALEYYNGEDGKLKMNDAEIDSKFRGLTSTLGIFIAGNLLTRVPSLKTMSRLRSLFLFNNKITMIKPGDFLGASRLVQLDIAKNLIVSIATEAFADLTASSPQCRFTVTQTVGVVLLMTSALASAHVRFLRRRTCSEAHETCLPAAHEKLNGSWQALHVRPDEFNPKSDFNSSDGTPWTNPPSDGDEWPNIDEWTNIYGVGTLVLVSWTPSPAACAP